MFKEEIRTRRHAMGLTQTQLAQFLGIPNYRTIQKWEEGKGPKPWVQKLILMYLDGKLKNR